MTRSKARHNTSEDVERRLTDKGVTWEFFQEFDLSLIDMERSLKNQARIAAPLNTQQVEVYTEAMKRGETFPPVVLWESPLKPGTYIVVDGNHRATAGIAAETPLAAYVLPKSTSAELVRLLTYEANTRHGLGTTKAERQQHAMWIIDNTERSMQDVAAELNLPYKELQRYVHGVRTDNRIRELRIPEYIWREIAPSSRNRLNTFADDDVFRASIEMAGKMRMNIEEINDFIRDIKVGRTSPEQLKIIADIGHDQRQRLSEVATGEVGAERKLRVAHTGPRRSLVSTVLFVNKVHSQQIGDLVQAITSEEAVQLAEDLRGLTPKLEEIVAALDEKAAEGL